MIERVRPQTILAITTAPLWQKALEQGEYTRSTITQSLDEVGFIHCSTPEQVVETANRHFIDQEQVLLLFIDASKVTSPVKFEPAHSGRPGLFPHVYGPLNLNAVYGVVPLPRGADKKFVEPTSPPELR